MHPRFTLFCCTFAGAVAACAGSSRDALKDHEQMRSSPITGLDAASDHEAGATSDDGALDFGNPNGDGSIVPNDAAFARNDAGEEITCDLGSAGSFATDESLDLFGDIVYFAKGKTLPPGRYRVKYEDGCMQYMAGQAWAVHASLGDPRRFQFWLVGASSAERLVTPPGTTGYLVGSGGFATFDECVKANQALPPIEIDFAGGPLGVWLEDDPYSDNLAGQDGRNPKWSLTLLGKCPVLE